MSSYPLWNSNKFLTDYISQMNSLRNLENCTLSNERIHALTPGWEMQSSRLCFCEISSQPGAVFKCVSKHGLYFTKNINISHDLSVCYLCISSLVVQRASLYYQVSSCKYTKFHLKDNTKNTQKVCKNIQHIVLKNQTNFRKKCETRLQGNLSLQNRPFSVWKKKNGSKHLSFVNYSPSLPNACLKQI